ncbi:MAG: aldehyde ferredoxin oxidoreductase family protein [Candidatus Heimdallarchaeaceae archaeon]
MDWQGYKGLYAVINLNNHEVAKEEFNEKELREFIGGRGFAIRYLFEYLPPKTDPLSQDNILIISTGPLDGTLAPSSGRYSIVAKSPLTNGIGYSNSGGRFGPILKYAGFDALIIKGQSEEPVYIFIDDGDIAIKKAKHLWGKDVWETDEIIKKELYEDVEVLAIGQAGENKVLYATAINNLSRAAARTGVGAVFGSKNLKAIAVRGTKSVSVAHPEKFMEYIDVLLKKIYDDPAYPALSDYGTSFLVDLAYVSGGLATRNNQTGIFEKYDNISSETFAEHYKVRSDSCFACPIHCGKFSSIKEGKYKGIKGGSPEYETIVCLGSKCAIGNLETIIFANNLCNKYGMDTISLGDTIAFVMELYEKGIVAAEDLDGLELSWGNEEAFLRLIHKIAFRQGIGDILADGVMRAAQRFGKEAEYYALHVKGMEPPAYDVRTAKAFGLGWATANRGADHLSALPNFELLGYDKSVGEEWFGSASTVDPYAWEGKAKMVFWHENFAAVVDSAEMCKYTCFSAYAVKPADMALLLYYATGWNYSEEELMLAGERIYNLERLFLIREGFKGKIDTLPKRFTNEPLPEGPAEGNVVELDKMLKEYYQFRDWDPKTTMPSIRKIEQLNLKTLWEKYGKRDD